MSRGSQEQMGAQSSDPSGLSPSCIPTQPAPSRAPSAFTPSSLFSIDFL